MFIFENGIAILYVEEKQKAVRIGYKTFFSDNDDLREVLLKAADLLKEKNYTSLIADSSHATDAICQSDMEWMMGTLFPKLIENGLRKFAVVEPEDIVAKLTVEQWFDDNTSDAQMPFEIKLFQQTAQALEWVSVADD